MAVAIERGAQAVREDGKGFASIMWETWSPNGWLEGDTFGRVAVPFENPDWVDIRFRMPSTDAHIGQLGLQDSRRVESGKLSWVAASELPGRPWPRLAGPFSLACVFVLNF